MDALIPTTASLVRVGDHLLVSDGSGFWKYRPTTLLKVARIEQISRESVAYLRFTFANHKQLDFVPTQGLIILGYWA